MAESGLIARLAHGYRDPARSMDGVLAARPGEGVLLALMLLATFVLFLGQSVGIMSLATAQQVPPTELRERLFSLLIETVVVGSLALYALGALTRMIGQALGGEGDWHACRAACAWAALLSAPFLAVADALEGATRAPNVAATSPAQIAATGVAMALGLVALYFWSACIARAHGASRPWGLFGVMVGIAALLNLAAMLTR